VPWQLCESQRDNFSIGMVNFMHIRTSFFVIFLLKVRKKIMFDMYIVIEPFYLSTIMFKLQTLRVEFQLSNYSTSRNGMLEEVLPNDNS